MRARMGLAMATLMALSRTAWAADAPDAAPSAYDARRAEIAKELNALDAMRYVTLGPQQDTLNSLDRTRLLAAGKLVLRSLPQDAVYVGFTSADVTPEWVAQIQDHVRPDVLVLSAVEVLDSLAERRIAEHIHIGDAAIRVACAPLRELRAATPKELAGGILRSLSGPELRPHVFYGVLYQLPTMEVDSFRLVTVGFAAALRLRAEWTDADRATQQTLRTDLAAHWSEWMPHLCGIPPDLNVTPLAAIPTNLGNSLLGLLYAGISTDSTHLSTLVRQATRCFPDDLHLWTFQWLLGQKYLRPQWSAEADSVVTMRCGAHHDDWCRAKDRWMTTLYRDSTWYPGH